MRRRVVVVIAAAAFALAGVIAAGVAGFPRESAARATSRPLELPEQLEVQVFQACLPSEDAAKIPATALGIGITPVGSDFSVSIEDQGSWQVQVDRHGIRVREDGRSGGDARLPAVRRAITVAQEFYGCLSPYRFADGTPTEYSRSQLLQLYKYDRTVLWPCLAGLGYPVGAPPTRQDFANSLTVRSVDPFRGVTLKRGDLRLLDGAMRSCPMQPAYLS